LGFAIPINQARKTADQLIKNGKATYPVLGVSIEMKFEGEGALITKDDKAILPGGPAAKAGLKAGDIITKFDGKSIEKPADLPRAVGNTKPGSRVVVTVFHRGASKDVNVTVVEVEPEKTASAVPEKKAPVANIQHLGLTLSDLTDAQKKESRIRSGVRVDAAVEAAARAGIREGDLILAVANTEISSVKVFEALMSRIDKTRPVSILIRRGDAAQYVLIRPVP
jgi:serine protease Do